MRVSDQLRATGRVVRGRIGVGIAEVTKDIAEPLGLASGRRAGAQRRAGRAGREVRASRSATSSSKFDDRQIERSSDLPRIVGNTKPSSRWP